jgi:hypothetical protein
MLTRVLLLSFLLLTAGCSAWREVPRPWSTSSLTGLRTARAILHDGSMVLLDDAVVAQSGDDLLLTGTPRGDDPVTAPRIPLSTVQSLERGRAGFGEVMLDQALNVVIGSVILAIAAAF